MESFLVLIITMIMINDFKNNSNIAIDIANWKYANNCNSNNNSDNNK